jgi:hypothetical protein
MSARLQYKALNQLGINGLNTQHSPTALDHSWLAEASNIVLREAGKISFRKGFKQLIQGSSDGSIGSIAEFKDGSAYSFFAGIDGDIHPVDLSVPTGSFGTAYAAGASGDDWQFINFNDKLYALQEGNSPLHYNGTAWSSTFTTPSGVTTFDPSCGTGHYGRLWTGGVTSDKAVLYYSDTLIGEDFNSGSDNVTNTYGTESTCEAQGHLWNTINNQCYTVPTSAGFINLKTVWGNDEIVAIKPFYGKLVIFGRHNIVIYNNPSLPSQMSLNEVINGVGCVSRDSVHNIGDDLVFLSDTGLRSLARTTEKDNIPLTDLSVNVSDTIIRHISQSSNTKGVYIENEGIYLLSFIDLNISYVFDFKHTTPNGAPRITQWSFNTETCPTNFLYSESRGFLAGVDRTAGSIAIYDGYYDKKVTGTSGGAASYSTHSYNTTVKTSWIDLGDGVGASLLKSMRLVLSGGAGTVISPSWFTDFGSDRTSVKDFEINASTSTPQTLFSDPNSSGTKFLYSCNTDYTYSGGTSNCTTDISYYTSTFGIKEYSIPMKGSAKYLQINLGSESVGYAAVIQDMTLLYKQGKIR